MISLGVYAAFPSITLPYITYRTVFAFSLLKIGTNAEIEVYSGVKYMTFDPKMDKIIV